MPVVEKPTRRGKGSGVDAGDGAGLRYVKYTSENAGDSAAVAGRKRRSVRQRRVDGESDEIENDENC